MKTYSGKTQVRTPEQLAKAAMKHEAITDLESHGLADHAKVTVEYMGIRHTLNATVTVNVKNGQILLHYGAVGANRLPFNPTVGDKTHNLSFGAGGNFFTGLEIDGWQEIRAKYNLAAIEADEDSDDSLSAGESV